MKELFDIIPSTTGKGFTMQLNTGTIDVPDKPGGYIISSGCGSGKTESIKSLIRQKYNEGILYCVDTREELKKMYNWIISDLVDDKPGEGLKSTDVMIVSSGSEFAYSLDQYRDKPEILMEKKIILITHVRFWTDLINYFLVYQPKEKVTPFDGNFNKLMQRKDLRGYILFDETPTFIKPFIELNISILGMFGKTDNKGNIVCKSPEEIRKYYDRFMKEKNDDPFNHKYRIDRIKRDVALNLIPKYYDSWMMHNSDKVSITFYPVDLCPESIEISTHILVYEGAGDLLLKNSKSFKLLDVEHKYNSTTEFKKIEFGIIRKGEQDEDKFNSFMDRVSGLIVKPSLVVCWKDINGEESESGKSEYMEKVRSELLKRGVNSSFLHLTYYGAADNKSTNNYRDIEQIILCGNWSLINAETAKIRRAYGTDTTSQEHKEWYFSQLITRIGIRKHQVGNYSVFYTDDFDESFIRKMDAYFNENRILNSGNRKQKDWEKKLDGMKIRKNIRKEIIVLAKYDKSMRNAIVMEQEYTKEVTFDYLEMIGIARDRRERRKYKTLSDVLKKMKIELVIKS
ncbi:hypothetical protein PO183_01625 [Bacteroides ovatus]|jgi:hypothetical protein|uniref:hypothetical protein n=1 Tax=Bacteroides ovatus TaxID=28116 RepID=UPI00233F01B6|nr:hypothetical protein [Bacteroides ovatus]MDC2364849.1 hypothetical protein [Bacteroides ovatus]